MVVKTNEKLKSVYENILIPGTRFLVILRIICSFDRTRLLFAQEAMQTDIDNTISKLYENDKIRRFEELNGKSFNPNSTVQLRSLMFDYLGLKPTGKKTGTGTDSTDAEVLKELSLQSPVPSLSWTYDKNLKSRILILTRSYLNWIEILTFAQALIYMVLLVVVSVLLVS